MAQQISTMDRTELGKWYAANIGYNPFEDDPAITTEEVRQIALEWILEAA